MGRAEMIRVQADGVEWTLESFIDARGFLVLDTDTPPDFASHPARLDAVLHDGTLQLDRFAPDLDWWAVAAVGVPILSNDFVHCEECGWIIPATLQMVRRGDKAELSICHEGCTQCGSGAWDEYGEY